MIEARAYEIATPPFTKARQHSKPLRPGYRLQTNVTFPVVSLLRPFGEQVSRYNKPPVSTSPTKNWMGLHGSVKQNHIAQVYHNAAPNIGCLSAQPS